jgi:hypothetical protein
MPRQFTTIYALGLLIAAATTVSCTSREEGPVTYERALEISREAAQKHGYDLGKYRLDTFGDPAADKDKWIVVYLCGPEPTPAPSGCSFMVVVDRKTGNAETYPGE